MVKLPDSHWWPLDARYTACGKHVEKDTVCSPLPTCAQCNEWIRLDAEMLARLEEPDDDPRDEVR
jgi:hypothetical protein